ncbi:XdhC family protein [Dactylosporangium aurantiacum]|uniref:XdhC family protein n=1 Tax=Dactylosporangium aurantiacum TaxID=35754 RepID=A0A9Q9MFD5_9ACTN|nr:XdhC family protein [Dactylosporangium aurantiacum]MDG6107520.1 XdhC family protein [Dactylosporangium aurantiacum]UWZ54309.1 XdhC family protein [Dactylosporangium aurantiacum]
MTNLLHRADRLRADRTPFVLATVVRAERPTSAKAGDRALVLPDGTMEGFVGGTCAESTVRLQGLRLLETGESTLLRITPSGESAEREGLLTVANPCLSGGTLEIFLETMIPAPLVYVHGEAPVARALVDVARAVGWEGARGPADALPLDAAAVVVASHGRDEIEVLTAAVKAGVPYVALVASRKRAAAVLAELPLTDLEKARIHAPAGMDIGARTAPEVALSILAEIISRRPRQTAPPPGRIELPLLQPVRPVTQVAVAKDVVCAMDVAISPDALQYEHEGTMYYFCGSGCRRAFIDNPARYL